MTAAPTAAARAGRLRAFVVALLGIHGVIHLMAPADRWGWATLDEPVTPSVTLSETWQDMLAGVWLLATVLLVAAAVLLLFRRSAWWRRWALTGVVVSQGLTVLWWQAAGFATAANLLIVLAVWYDRRGELRPAPVPIPPAAPLIDSVPADPSAEPEMFVESQAHRPI